MLHIYRILKNKKAPEVSGAIESMCNINTSFWKITLYNFFLANIQDIPKGFFIQFFVGQSTLCI